MKKDCKSQQKDLRKVSKSGTATKISVECGSGNVFADLRLRGPEAHLAKAQLIVALAAEIKSRGLRQVQVARQLGLTQPKISKLLSGDTSGFSTDKITVC
ncbi:MAG: transcriptional regulator [Candidatus Eremiobacter antarcticus]|nr:XRE family transcriptional regulator [Candidatus Eremiobacteraeota bacterium]MBC5807104.1 XRE family transcriptional regulator [Candidatus Eremiobacteraeota bacterium]PZR62409.1 MAG: transcriptional regulator [Candidatus Eremiobacter sp. RRmetagenome_bin22]